MSDLFDNPGGWPVPILVLGASLVGSWHCVGMCGPLMVTLTSKGRGQVSYHLGRLIAYLLLGVVAGWAGERALLSEWKYVVTVPVFSMVALILVGVGWSMFRGRAPHVSSPIYGWFLSRGRIRNPFVVGTLSGLLPCGWLYSFVLAAVAVGGVWNGVLILGLFWLGTVPALAVAHATLSRVIRRVSSRARLSVAALSLLLAGGVTVYFRVLPILVQATTQDHPVGVQSDPFCHPGSVDMNLESR